MHQEATTPFVGAVQVKPTANVRRGKEVEMGKSGPDNSLKGMKPLAVTVKAEQLTRAVGRNMKVYKAALTRTTGNNNKVRYQLCIPKPM